MSIQYDGLIGYLMNSRVFVVIYYFIPSIKKSIQLWIFKRDLVLNFQKIKWINGLNYWFFWKICNFIFYIGNMQIMQIMQILF